MFLVFISCFVFWRVRVCFRGVGKVFLFFGSEIDFCENRKEFIVGS